MHIRCIYLWSTPLDPDGCMYDCMYCIIHVLMKHMPLMRMNACIHVWCINLWCRVFSLQTKGQINKPIYIGVHRDVCVYDAYIYDLWSLILTCVYDACINVCKLWCIYLLSLILIHVCMMCTYVCTMCTYDVSMVCLVHISMILVFDLGTCMYDARN